MNKTGRIFFVFTLAALFSASVAAQAPAEKFVNVFGAKIRYLEAGDATKPAVILLHGLGGNADASWPLTIPALSANYRVIAPDIIGFGKSEKPLMNYRIGFFVDFLDKFMAETKIEKASITGNSMGGWIAVMFASKYPGRANKLVLVDAAGYAPPKDFNYGLLSLNMNPSTREGIREGAKLLFYNHALFTTDAAVDAMLAARIAANDGYTIQTLLRNAQFADDYFDDEVKALKHATLIAWGKQDGITPLVIGERLNKEIAGSELAVFDQAGHFPQVEKAADFNKRVLEFLAK